MWSLKAKENSYSEYREAFGYWILPSRFYSFTSGIPQFKLINHLLPPNAKMRELLKTLEKNECAYFILII